MIDEAAIERLLPSLLATKGEDDVAIAARAAADRLLDLLDTIARVERETALAVQ